MAQYSVPNSTILKIKRSDLQPGDIIIGPAPRDLPLVRQPRPRYLRRTSSVDRDDFLAPYRGRGAIARRRDQADVEDRYNSEGSIPPRSRMPALGNEKQKRQQLDRGRSSSSSASSSDLGCTSDDEKIKNKAKWKKWGAIGLAGVATIHAVHGVHETMEKTAARRKELAEGKISEGEAHKRKTKGRWRTAADVGVAGVWVKSAYDEIKEYREAQKEYAEAIEKCEERHRKRLEKARSIKREEYSGHHILDAYERRKNFRRDDNDDD